MKRFVFCIGLVIASLGLSAPSASALKITVRPDPVTGKCPKGSTVFVDWDGKPVYCVITIFESKSR